MTPPEEQQTTETADVGEDKSLQNGGEADQQNGGQEDAPTSSKAGTEEPEEDVSRKRLWFVRMPRPAEASAAAIKPLEQELEAFRTQFNLITEALNVKKVERDSAREATRGAREAFTQSRATYDERAAPLKKLQEQRQDAAASASKLKANFSDLLVKSEAELDAQLAALHYRIEHESITLNEEKKALATIKKLEQQRERVREYESSASLFAESKAKRSEIQDMLKEHEGELSALRQEMDMQRQILDKLRERERGIDKEVEEIIGERRRCKELMDAAFHRLSATKKAQREKNNAFYANRTFSKDVRKLLAEGKVEEARAQCAEQTEEAVAQLAADPAYRAEYFALWETQRKAPVLLPSVDDLDAELPPPSKGAKGAKKKAAAEPVDPAKKAEAAIAALLEGAKEEARRARAAATAAAAAAEHEAASAAAAAAPASPGGEAEAPAVRHDVVGLEAEAAGAQPKPHAKPAKPQPAPKLVVEPVVEPPENFELPEAVRLKEKTPSSHELKELERERNRQAQLEAERRKAKKAADKERKRQRQEALAREALAAATRAAEAAASAQVAAAAAARLAAANDADAAAGSDTASSDGGAGQQGSAAAGAESAGAEPAAAASSGVEQRKKGGSKPLPAPLARAMAPRPAARRPAGSKQSGLVRQAKKAAKENSLVLVAALVGVSALMLFALFWTSFSVAPQ